MATIQGLTAPRMLEIEAAAIVAGVVDENMHLILTKHDGTTIDAGKVQGDGVPMGGTEGQIIIKTVDGSIWADNFATNVEQVVKNSTGATLTKGTAVYVSGASGDNVLVSKAQANSEGTSSKTLGLLHNDVANGATGQVITEGTLYGFNTSAATVGDPVWLSPTTAGGLVYGLANKPTVPNHMVYLGVVIRSHAVNGAIYVKVQNGYELDELHDVKITNPQPKQVIKRDPTNSFWLNEAASGGVTVSETLPVDPSVGDGWFYSKDGTLFFRYFDGTNYAYVQADVPLSPTIEQRYFSPNYVVNGGFDVWQRGTSTSTTGFLADRWQSQAVGGSGYTQSRQSLDYGVSQATSSGEFYYRHQHTAGSGVGDYALVLTRIEDVRTLANNTVTFSFWATADSSRNLSVEFSQYFGTGGSSTVNSIGVTKLAVTTSVTRYTVTATLPSISGKTIGAGSFLEVLIWFDAGSNFNSRTSSLGHQSGAYTFNIWGVQLEIGSTATAFRRNANSIQGELAACQRYYYNIKGGSADGGIVQGHYYSGTSLWCTFSHPVPMRANPTVSIPSLGTISVYSGGGGNRGYSSLSLYGTSSSQLSSITMYFNVLNATTVGVGGWVAGPGTVLAFDSEL